MPSADSRRSAGPFKEQSQGSLDSANSWIQAANDASVAKQVLTALQSIQQSQRRMEALLGRMADSGGVLQPPDSKETSDTPAPTRSNSSDLVAQLKRNRQRASVPVSGTDSDSIQHMNSDSTDSSTRRFPRTSYTQKPLSLMRTLTRESSMSRCMSMSDLPSDAFIAATLPLSWPTVLVARSTYEKNSTSPGTALQNTAMACSRMWSTGFQRKPLQDGESSRWRYIISPGSTVHMIHSCFSLLMLLYDFTVIPVILAWDLDMTGFLGFTGILSVIFWTADMFLSFLTAFYAKGELVVRPTAIAKRYFRTWFLFDFLSISADWASIVIQAMVSTDNDSKRVRLIRLVKIARLLRIIGVLRMFRFLNGLREQLEKQCSGYFRVAMKTISLLLVIMFLTHVICCAWYALGKLGPSDTGMRWVDIFVGDFQIEEKRIYQYVTSLHWAAAQMTLGATDVNSSNSMERCANIACMLIGLIFSCTLVSSLSASLVDLSVAQKDQKEKMEAIRKYLKENYISATTCLLVEDQASERLREEKKGFFYEGESCMQKLLSHQLFARLRHEVFLPIIVTHPLLRLWNSVHEPTMHRLSVEAFEFRVLQVGDDLFEAGGKANEAYFIIQGELEYTQHPDSSPEVKETKQTVSQGTWLCEAALWSEWIHVGTAVVTQRSTLALLKAEELLKVCKEHTVVKTIVTSYCESFHSKIVRSVPPEEHWPNDLVVPCTGLAQVVVSMPKEAQVAISWNTLHNCSAQLFGLTGWAAKKFRSSLSRQLDRLEEEVTQGLSVVIQVGSEVLRVVSMACVRLLDEHQRVLVQIGKGEEAVEGVDPVCQLPGQKVLEGAEEAAEMLAQVLQTKLPVLAGSALEIEQVEREEAQEFSRFYLLKTTYFRTVVTARCSGAWAAEPLPLAQAPARPEADKAGLSVADNMFLERLMQNQVYCVENEKGVSGLYAWLPEEAFEELHTNSSGHHLVAKWIGRLARSFAVRVTVLPHLRPEQRRSRSSTSSGSGHLGGLGGLRNSGGRRESRSSGTTSFPTDYEQEIRPPSRASSRSSHWSCSSGSGVQSHRTRQLNRCSLVSISSASWALSAGARLPDVEELEEAPGEEELGEVPKEEEIGPTSKASSRWSRSTGLGAQSHRARQLDRRSLVSLSSASPAPAAGARLPHADELEQARREEELEELPS